jgi:hypothetical protein
MNYIRVIDKILVILMARGLRLDFGMELSIIMGWANQFNLLWL